MAGTTNRAGLGRACEAVFASLPRSDQRRRAHEYVDGLLRVRGRRSIRNIAGPIGGPAAEQRLHHFVAKSTWDWDQVRRTLAEQQLSTRPVQAVVVRPLLIPKLGQHTVGVEPKVLPGSGRTVNAQQAVGVWLASQGVATPVNWRLHLPSSWLDDPPRRAAAKIPPGLTEESAAVAVLRSVATVGSWLPTAPPVVLDCRGWDPVAVTRAAGALAGPFALRIDPGSRLRTSDPRLTGHPADGVLSAGRLAHLLQAFHRPVPRPTGTAQLSLTVRARPGPAEAALSLVCLGAFRRPWPGELWLTDAERPVEVAVQAHAHAAVVEHEVRLAAEVGLRDFAGRSYGGWHRHMTMVSVAHALDATARADRMAEACTARTG